MRESNEVSCNCYGPVNYNQQKFFLARKRDNNQQEAPLSVRRVNKSAEVKADSQNKTNKKSLKKRPGSAHQHEQPLPLNGVDLAKNEFDIKLRPPEQIQPKSRSFWARGAQTPMVGYQPASSNINSIRFPETTTNYRQTTLLNNPYEYPSTSNLGHTPLNFHPYSNIPQEYPNGKPSSQLRPQLQQLYNETIGSFDQHMLSFKQTRVKGLQEIKGKQVISKESLVPQSNYYPSQFKPHTQSQSLQLKKEPETWNFTEEDLMIEGFDRLFKDKEQQPNHSHNKEQKHHHLKFREVQNSKRLEKQALFGRFAESDGGDSDSQSPPSEVIGRGFDRTYQDLLQYDNEGVVHQQTKASCSTNTKVSQLHQGRLSENSKTIFGNVAHFKSYKYL